VRLTIINSTAPGTVTLWSPFFDALAGSGEVELTVLEQLPRADYRQWSRQAAGGSDASRPYQVKPLPTYFYNRRHACAQVLSRRFRPLLADTSPDVIHILGEPGYLSTYQVVQFARRHLPKTKLSLFAAQNIYQRFPPPFPSVERRVLARIDHAFPIGQGHADVLRRKGYAGPATHLPLGVDTTIFTPERQSKHRPAIGLPRPVVGYVGDLLPARDVPLLVEAVALCRTAPSLLVVGDGSSRPELELLPKEHGLDGRFRFTGQVLHTRVPDYLNCMDLLVLPSRAVRNRCFGVFRIANAEQFGRVLVEAMACGKPVVGSSCGEIPNVIGDAGRVYPEGDRDALAAVLEELCADEKLRQRLGRAARARARTCYDWRVIARRFLSAVRGMLAPAAVTLHNVTPVGEAEPHVGPVPALTSCRTSSPPSPSMSRVDPLRSINR